MIWELLIETNSSWQDITWSNTGPEKYQVLRDEEHARGARITLEKCNERKAFVITCGIYGWMVHTRFFTREAMALQSYKAMKSELSRILSSFQSDDEIIVSVKRFIERFP